MERIGRPDTAIGNDQLTRTPMVSGLDRKGPAQASDQRVERRFDESHLVLLKFASVRLDPDRSAELRSRPVANEPHLRVLQHPHRIPRARLLLGQGGDQNAGIQGNHQYR